MEIFGFDTNHVTDQFSWFHNLGSPQSAGQTWGLLVAGAFILLIAVSVFSIIIFTQVSAGNFASANAGTDANETVTLNRQDLNEAVSNLQKRRATFDLLRDRQPDIPNPSR